MSLALRASCTALAATTMLVACGSRSLSPVDDDGQRDPYESGGGTGADPSTGGTMANGGAGTGGTTATGGAGTGGIAQGGSTGGAGTGAPSGAGGTGSGNSCAGIGRGCTEGAVCPLICGIADSGRRTCTCMANDWTCTDCDFSNGASAEPPSVIEECPPDVVDELPCTNELSVCGPTDIGEYCACWQSPSDGLSWDCDDPPPHWGL